MCFILCFFVVFKTVFLPRRQRAGPGPTGNGPGRAGPDLPGTATGRAGPELNGPGRAEKNGPVQASQGTLVVTVVNAAAPFVRHHCDCLASLAPFTYLLYDDWQACSSHTDESESKPTPSPPITIEECNY